MALTTSVRWRQMSSVMSASPARSDARAARDVTGEFVNRAGERFYSIRNVDDMPPFFMSVISSDDHWIFVSSTGGLTAGRVSPETALFPRNHASASYAAATST